MTEHIPYLKLPNSHRIPVLGLGTWQLHDRECTTIVEQALDLGYRHIDTAEMYENETAIGRAIRHADRSDLFITSKVWITHFRYKDTINACEKSLRKLGCDYLDLYLIHWPNSGVPMAETFKALGELVERGLIRSAGVSNFSIHHLEEAQQVSPMPIATNQIEFHPYLNQKKLLDYCTRLGIPVTAWAPIARGEIFTDPLLKKIAGAHGKSVVQVALRWLLRKGMIVIPKTGKVERLKENMAVFDFELSGEEMDAIDGIRKEYRIVDLSFSE